MRQKEVPVLRLKSMPEHIDIYQVKFMIIIIHIVNIND